MKAMASKRRKITIGFDTEYVELPDDRGNMRRHVISWQFWTPDPRDPSIGVSVVVIALDGARLRLETGLRLVFEAARLYDHRCTPPALVEGGVPNRLGRVWAYHDENKRRHIASTPEDAAKLSAWPAERDSLLASIVHREGSRSTHLKRKGSQEDNRIGHGCGWEFAEWAMLKHAADVQLVAHAGQADLTTFHTRADDVDLLRFVTKVGGGLATREPARVLVSSRTRGRSYPVKLTVRDTMAHSAAGKQRLHDLSESCGLHKLDVGEAIERMDLLWERDPTRFVDYAANDAEIVVEYCARLWGDGREIPMTLPSASAKALRSSCKSYMGIAPRDNKTFNAKFAGMREAEFTADNADGDAYHRERGLEPLNLAAQTYQNACARAYKGGYNGCSTNGHFEGHTYDLDLENAYPTAMSLVQDLDFEGGCHDVPVIDTTLDLSMFPSPTTPFVGEIEFEFPPDTAFPCIPVTVGGAVIYAHTSSGFDGVFACGPEIWLALQMGARVTARVGYFGKVLQRDDGSPSRSLREGVRQLITDRAEAKKVFGKGSLEELFFKIAVNALYGKTAQQVAPKGSWNAFDQIYAEVGGSVVTSPHHAAMTTSLVRAMLLATMTQLTERGFTVHSVTTDGFISDAPLDVVAGLDLFGLTRVVEDAREDLTGDRTMWSLKHEQDELLNGMTRLNISLETGDDEHDELAGVLAHGGVKTPASITRDSLEDRQFMWDLYVTREGPIENSYAAFPPFSQLSSVADRQDFLRTERSRQMRLDFDLKRRPVPETLTETLVPDSTGQLHPIARFWTKPWRTVDEAIRAREIARQFPLLKTAEQWRAYFVRLEASSGGYRVRTTSRSILMSILVGHRQGMWIIPNLEPHMSVEDRLAWLELLGLGSLKMSDWKNARRSERQAQVLPRHLLEPHLSKAIATPVGLPPGMRAEDANALNKFEDVVDLDWDENILELDVLWCTEEGVPVACAASVDAADTALVGSHQ